MIDLHVDGNALGGLLNELFGRDMTDQLGCCGGCGNVSPSAPSGYSGAPGT